MGASQERAKLVYSSPSPSLSREHDFEKRFRAAEARLIRAAAALIRRAGETLSIRRAILQACDEVSPSNDESPINKIVPFWVNLSETSKHKVGKLLRQDSLVDLPECDGA